MLIQLSNTEIETAIKEYITKRGVAQGSKMFIEFKVGRKGNGASAYISVEPPVVKELDLPLPRAPLHTQEDTGLLDNALGGNAVEAMMDAFDIPHVGEAYKDKEPAEDPTSEEEAVAAKSTEEPVKSTPFESIFG